MYTIFFNNGQTEQMELKQLSHPNARKFARQLSACPLVHTVRVQLRPQHKGQECLFEYHDGAEVTPAGLMPIPGA